MQDPNRKTSIATGTRSLRIIDVFIAKDSHRNGLDDFEKMAGNWIKNKTIVADAEFDAEERFHEIVIVHGGKGVAPLRHKNTLYGEQKGRDARNCVGNGPAEVIIEGHYQRQLIACSNVA